MSFFENPRCARRSNAGSLSFSAGTLRVFSRKSSPRLHLLNTNLMSNAVARPLSILVIASSVKPLAFKRRVVDGGCLAHGAMADGVGFHLRDLALAIAERAQGFRHGLVDDLEVAAAGQLLELHQREVGLDARRVAVHHKADGAGRRDDGRLRVAVAVRLTKFDGAVPGALGGRDEPLVRAVRVVQRHRRDRQLVVAVLLAVGRLAVVLDRRAACRCALRA